MSVRELAKKYGVEASGNPRPFFGSVDNTCWAVCIEGVDNKFPEQPFGHQLVDLRKAREFMKLKPLSFERSPCLQAGEASLHGWAWHDELVEVFYKD